MCIAGARAIYPPYPKAPKVYEILINVGHTICQITAKIAAASNSPIGFLSRRFLKKWLAANGFNCHKLILCSNLNVSVQKPAHCREQNTDIMIEDDPDTAMLLGKTA